MNLSKKSICYNVRYYFTSEIRMDAESVCFTYEPHISSLERYHFSWYPKLTGTSLITSLRFDAIINTSNKTLRAALLHKTNEFLASVTIRFNSSVTLCHTAIVDRAEWRGKKQELDVLYSAQNNGGLRFVRHSRYAQKWSISYECKQYTRCHITVSRVIVNDNVVLPDPITLATVDHKR